MATLYTHGFVLLHLNLCLRENYFSVLFFLVIDSSVLICLRSLKKCNSNIQEISACTQKIVKNISVLKNVSSLHCNLSKL